MKIFKRSYFYGRKKIHVFTIHYEKSCFLNPHCPAIRAPKQLIYNYITTKTWKYG
jgi:hypothetical protein